MPLYEFNCNNQECEKDVFEVLTTFDSPDVPRCPDCKHESFSRKKYYQFNFRI